MKLSTCFLHTALVSLTICNAYQLPFRLPFFSDEPASSGKRVAIIGAGASGSSAAFWISKARDRYGVDVGIDVYEKSDYIGGRSTTIYPYNDTSIDPIELGASIFIPANKILWRATEEFGLKRIAFENKKGVTGIWNGQQFTLQMESGNFFREWWSTVKVLLRYGWSAPVNTKKLVRKEVDAISTLYSPSSPAFPSIQSLISRFSWPPLLAQSVYEKLTTSSVGTLFVEELVGAATRVNYGQNPQEIHALGGLVTMAASKASSVNGGNWQIFEKFLKRSKAKVYLNTEVTKLVQTERGWRLHSLGAGPKQKSYDAIILAAPHAASNIQLEPSTLPSLSSLPNVEYVNLHVTILTTTAPAPQASFFNLESGTTIPTVILTAGTAASESRFNSLSYLREVRPGQGGEWVVKIFSKEEISEEFLAAAFGKGKVGWVYRKLWQAYPYLRPMPLSSSEDTSSALTSSIVPPLRIAPGLYYPNSFEPVISTMETSAIAARNVVEVMLRDLGESGVCGAEGIVGEDDFATKGTPNPTLNSTSADAVGKEIALFFMSDEEAAKQGFVLGWDCPS